jgi:hypothetical protein
MTELDVDTASTLAPDMADHEKPYDTRSLEGDSADLDLEVTPSTRNSTRQVDRVLSQNGYGVSHEQNNEKAVEEGQPEKDPYEVGWDDGDNDPLSPRSFSKPRKWLIVFIVAAGSLTV